MNQIITLTILLSCMLNLGLSQNLEYNNAEKFDFKSVSYDNNTGFDNPAIICNHLNALSDFDIDFDPMGILSSSIFFFEDNKISYSGTFYGESEVNLKDVSFNKTTEHETILLQLKGPCNFISSDGEELNFDFPKLEKMSGIIDFSKEDGVDTYWTSHFIWDDFRYQKLWNAGDLTLISGALLDSLIYINPDNSKITLLGSSVYNACVIAIDENGFYKWSYISEGGQYISIVEHNNEIVISHDRLLKSKLIHLDKDGNELKVTPVLLGLVILKVDFDEMDNMFICGMYNQNAPDTNIDLNEGEYFLEYESGNGIDAYLIKYDSEGNLEWAQTITGSEYDSAINFDFNGDYIYLTGGILEDAVFDKIGENMTEFQVDEFSNAYISKYHKDGTMEWVELFENEDICNGLDIDVDADGLSIFGSFRGEFDANPNSENTELLFMDNPGNSRSHFHVQLTEKTSSILNTPESGRLLMPNPVSFYLSTLKPNDKIIYIKDFTACTIGNYNSNIVDVSILPDGMYIVTIESNGKIQSQLVSIIH